MFFLPCQVYAMDKLRVDNVNADLYKKIFTLIDNNILIWFFLCSIFGAVMTTGSIEYRAKSASKGFIISMAIWTIGKTFFAYRYPA